MTQLMRTEETRLPLALLCRRQNSPDKLVRTFCLKKLCSQNTIMLADYRRARIKLKKPGAGGESAWCPRKKQYASSD